jgi:energy-coupling factor transporter ATP-binding protein EcfA2
MTDWTWPGARWWKLDLHTHTPASKDYGKGPNQEQHQQWTPRDWLLDYMRAGIDCVAITDHNTGAWVDDLEAALVELEKQQPEGFRVLYLFPGMEISASGGLHLLAIFDAGKCSADLDALRGAMKYRGTPGACDGVTEESSIGVIQAVEKAGGLVIPAHVDEDNGLYKQPAQTLKQILECRQIFAMEVINPSSPKPQAFTEGHVKWTEVLGSDSHHPGGKLGQRYPGSHFTWVKMGKPGIEGLRLALLDGPLSARRSDQEAGDPNAHGPMVVESIEISNARYMGRANPFTLELNPWLNAVIGGRGTGKSTLVEFLRIALRREGELPEALKPDFEKYRKVYRSREDDGLLTEESLFRVTYRKADARFRIQWSPRGDADPIQQETTEGHWVRAEGDISQRFPVRLYSQKQIYQLARAPLALLQVVDDAAEVDRRSWEERWQQEQAQYLSLRAKAREIEVGLADEARLRGELDDVQRKLAVFEESGHADILKAFQRRRRQQQVVENWESTWADAADRLRQVARDLVPEPPAFSDFDPEAPEDRDLHRSAASVRENLERLGEELKKVAGRVDEILADWHATRDNSPWQEALAAALEAYAALRDKLAVEGVGDPAAYGELVQRRQTIERRLADLAARKTQLQIIRGQADSVLQRLPAIRRELTARRREFLEEVLKENRYVRIRVVPYGSQQTVEVEIRRLLQREGGGFEKDIGSPEGEGLLGRLYSQGEDPDTIERGLDRLKQEIRNTADGNFDPDSLRDQRFATHLGKLQPEQLDRLDCWFPEDSLDVQYSTGVGGQGFRSIQEGSPGQKTAALLAFLLSYGAEPLVLDQPEDDLDNHLIYELIVTQLREVKHRRQLIVVTHNPNIVVNGDAELVVALAARGGETKKESEGSLQEKAVRDTICDVMEGGREAFELRYRRILLGARNV